MLGKSDVETFQTAGTTKVSVNLCIHLREKHLRTVLKRTGPYKKSTPFASYSGDCVERYLI